MKVVGRRFSTLTDRCGVTSTSPETCQRVGGRSPSHEPAKLSKNCIQISDALSFPADAKLTLTLASTSRQPSIAFNLESVRERVHLVPPRVPEARKAVDDDDERPFAERRIVDLHATFGHGDAWTAR